MTETQLLTVCDDPDTEPARGTPEHALWLVYWHLEWENSKQLEKLETLYTPDIEWEFHLPGMVLMYQGRDEVLANYNRLLDVLQDLKGTLIDRYSTTDRAYLDQQISYRVGSGSEGLMDPSVLPPGSELHGRLLHNFHISDALLSREVAYFIPSPPPE